MLQLFRFSAAVLTMVVLGAVIVGLVIRAIAFRDELNEKAAFHQVAAVQSAQEAYPNYNDGYFGDLECLFDPKHCLDGV